MFPFELHANTDLALEIAKTYGYLSLESTKDEKGMIALQLLSDVPSAFKSGRNYGLLQRFIYYSIIKFLQL
jgi:hypothetical protein